MTVSGLVLIVGMSVISASGPDDAFKAAALDMEENVLPADRPFTRYLSLYAVADDRRPAMIVAIGYWLNHISLTHEIVHPFILNQGSLVRIDLRSLGWKTDRRPANESDIWELLAQRDPYFKVSVKRGDRFIRGWIDPVVEQRVRTASRSTLFVLRADWFLEQTGFDVPGSDRVNYGAALRASGMEDREFRDVIRESDESWLRVIAAGGVIDREDFERAFGSLMQSQIYSWEEYP